jgi:hypothetical protein
MGCSQKGDNITSLGFPATNPGYCYEPMGIGQPSKHRSLTVAAPFEAYSIKAKQMHLICEDARNGAATVRERCLGNMLPQMSNYSCPQQSRGNSHLD